MPTPNIRLSDAELELRIRQARETVALSKSARVALQKNTLHGGDGNVWFGPYTIRRRVGEGAMGRVYEAFDRRRGQVIALKKFHNIGPITARLLKREFRALSGIRHPNLVIFHDLCVRADICYFTMELVKGEDFIRYVRPAGVRASDPERLRSALRQLAEAVHALHQAQKVHRDLKPSNVLVTHEDGRVVVLDFGLIASASEGGDATFSGQIVGTPAYMAPEQFRALPVTPAVDCYAIGSMLYQALVGEPPFYELAPHDAIAARASAIPELPSSLADRELGELCRRLLHPDPRARADCKDILARLSGGDPSYVAKDASKRSDRAAFVGREPELGGLRAALHAAEDKCVVVVVGGVPGMGKTALVSRFLEGLDRRDYIVLTARCHERESLPYKILDGFVDGLVQFIAQLTASEAGMLLPRYARELALMFPALSRIQAFAEQACRGERVLDGQEHKRRAIVALRELLARIADRGRVVICVEDLHWGDRDSFGFIRQLLMSPDAPSCLCIGTTRLRDSAEGVDSILRGFVGSEHIMAADLDVRGITLAALAPEQSRALANSLLAQASIETAAMIATESGGNPQLILELADFACADSLHTLRANPASLADLVAERVAHLSVEAGELLRVVALAGGSVDREVASLAAGLTSGSAVAAIQQLKEAQLIHTHGFPGHGQLDLYHSQLARPVLKDLDASQLRELHGRLAVAFAQRGKRQDERLIRHLRRAGQVHEAVGFVLDCAERASKALAYEHAAHLYALALKWGVPASQLESALIKRGDALRSAGCGPEAARAYVEAAQVVTSPILQRELRCRAAQEFLLSGHLAPGREILHSLIPLPRSQAGALAGLAAGRVALQFRGLRFRPRAAASIPSESLAEFDNALSLAQTLLMVDPLLGRLLQSRLLLRALSLGESTRVLRALALEAVCRSALQGPRAKPGVQRILALAQGLNDELDQPVTRATTTMWTAVCSYCMAEPERAIAEAASAEFTLREESPAVAYEMATIQLVVLRSQMMLGQWRDFVRRAQEAIREALQRGNLYLSAALRTHTHMACLVADDVEGSAKEIDAARRDWPQEELHCQNLAILLGETRMHLYRGNGQRAWRHLDELWPRLRRSLLLQFPAMRVDLVALRGRAAALAYAETGLDRYRNAAEQDARRLANERFRGALGAGLLIRASTAIADGNRAAALQHLYGATDAFERDELPFFISVARYQAGRCAGDEPLAQSSEQEIRRTGVRNCAAFVRMYTG